MRIAGISSACLALFMGSAVLDAAYPKTFTTQKIGAWAAFEGTDDGDNPVCGIINSGVDRVLTIKRWASSSRLVVQIFETSWQIPKDTIVRVDVQVDEYGWWNAKAGSIPPDGLEFNFQDDRIEGFLRELALGQKIYIKFPEGSEPPWVGGLAGSAKMVFLLADCVSRMGPKPPPTQPYGATQPYAPSVSLPYGKGDSKF